MSGDIKKAGAFVNGLSGAFVIGFAFDLEKNQLLLIEKKRPLWMAGLLNGVGGKIEPHESPEQAMAREFFEEANVSTLSTDWKLFHYEKRFDGPELWFFCADIACLMGRTKSMTDERLLVYTDIEKRMASDETIHGKLMYNLKFLIPMARCYLQFPEHRYTPMKPRLFSINEPESDVGENSCIIPRG